MNTTAQAEAEALEFVKKLGAKFEGEDERVYGIKQFMRKKGGVGYKILSLISSKRAKRILEEAAPDVK